MNLQRSLYPQLLESLQTFPVVGLIGPRQVGKTSLARQLAADLGASGTAVLMLDLERPSDLAKLTEPELFLEPLADHLVILDEVQLKPDLFSMLRSLVDAQRTPVRFLILGSAAPTHNQHASETLAGRIEFLELAPLSLAEVRTEATSQTYSTASTTLWSRGGYPDAYLARSDVAAMRWRE
nr:AAA family ATPase [Rhodoferax sp.]